MADMGVGQSSVNRPYIPEDRVELPGNAVRGVIYEVAIEAVGLLLVLGFAVLVGWMGGATL